MTISSIPIPVGGDMAPGRKMTKEEKQWRAQDDAHTLAAAQQIAEDKTRLAAAKQEAARMASDAAKRAQQLVSVAQTPAAKKAAAKKRVAKKAVPKRAAAKRAPRRR